jgi:hypothetical protein
LSSIILPSAILLPITAYHALSEFTYAFFVVVKRDKIINREQE